MGETDADYKNRLNDLRMIDNNYFSRGVYAFAIEQREKIHDISNNCDVLLTHYGGRKRAIAEKYKYDKTTDYFYFDGESIENLWVFGHQHTHYEDSNTFVNPCGYPFENNIMKVKRISC